MSNKLTQLIRCYLQIVLITCRRQVRTNDTNDDVGSRLPSPDPRVLDVCQTQSPRNLVVPLVLMMYLECPSTARR